MTAVKLSAAKVAALFIALFALATPVFASSSTLDEEDVRRILNTYELSARQVDAIIDQLNHGPKKDGKKLTISGVLFGHGLHGSLFASTWNWDFNATFRDPESDELVEVKRLYNVHYNNGGLALGVGYQWVFVFLPEGTSVHNLDGAIYGRGLGLTLDAGIGLNAQWLPGNNRAGHAFVVAPELGIHGGIRFPKMTFHQKKIVKSAR